MNYKIASSLERSMTSVILWNRTQCGILARMICYKVASEKQENRSHDTLDEHIVNTLTHISAAEASCREEELVTRPAVAPHWVRRAN